ncbi:unnamed protein product, partial [Mesorhabditis belari]|uniref:Lysosome-associated membrane glycoprotein 2-like transmembrane domain-containing protein n=1 Tax=Mesorhabditis belari TaxID=2138241 RepID=A0AAF3FJN2_9BILA
MRHLLCLLGLLAVTFALQQFSVKDGGKACFLLEADVEGEIKWKDGNETKSFSWKLDKVTQQSGECNGKREGLKSNRLEAQFLPKDTSSGQYGQLWIFTLELVQQTGDNKTYELVDWSLSFTPRVGINITDTYRKTKDAVTDLSAFGSNAYKCSNVGLALDAADGSGVGSVLTLKSVRAVAFASIDGDKFPEKQVYEVCSLDSKTSDIVPIIVGACLAGLVVVVLVAYLVGRARAKRQGYASV